MVTLLGPFFEGREAVFKRAALDDLDEHLSDVCPCLALVFVDLPGLQALKASGQV
jgi:hypothetical protein